MASGSVVTGIVANVASAENLSGGAGWVGAGLLGAVLSWLLLVRMPAWDKQMDCKDKQLQAIIENRDKIIREIADNHDKSFAIAEKDRREDFQRSLQTVADHCQREAESIRGVLEKEIAESSAAILDLRRVMGDFHDTLLRVQANLDSHNSKVERIRKDQT